MCDRYFVQLPPKEPEPVTAEDILEQSLALFRPTDVMLHPNVFLIPFEPRPVEKRKMSDKGPRSAEDEAAAILTHNLKFMIRKTRNFGLLAAQFHWMGMMTLEEKCRALMVQDDALSIAALFMTMLKKDGSQLTQFVNSLHMTGNHVIANVIEAKLELLVDTFGICDHPGVQCTISIDTSLEECEWHGHSSAPKKRKTSADSGIDSTNDDGHDDDDGDDDDDGSDDDAEEEQENSYGVRDIDTSIAHCVEARIYKCDLKPLRPIELIAIIHGEEELDVKVELCRCNSYHEYPKWKDAGGSYSHPSNRVLTNIKDVNTAKPGSSFYTSSKYPAQKSSAGTDKRGKAKLEPRRPSILSKVKKPVEMGSDLRDGVDENVKFTKPRGGCPKLGIRFGPNDFSEHPDNIARDESPRSLKSRLPRFLRRLF